MRACTKEEEEEEVVQEVEEEVKAKQKRARKASLDIGVNKVLNFRSSDVAQPSHSWTICIIYL